MRIKDAANENPARRLHATARIGAVLARVKLDYL